MLAYAVAPRAVNAWDRSQDKLPPVDVNEILLQIEATGRPTQRVAALRQSMGLPLNNPGFERTLKEKGYWPADARPLDFDISDLLYMQPRMERGTVYGLLMGLTLKDIARHFDYSTNQIWLYARSVKERLHMLADFLGATGDADPEGQIKTEDILTAMGATGNEGRYRRCSLLGIPDGPFILRKDFRPLWLRLPRWEDVPHHYVYQLQTYVTPDTLRTYFQGPMPNPDAWNAPDSEWVNETTARQVLRVTLGEFTGFVSRRELRPHLIPGKKGTWFKRSDVEALRRPAG